MYESGASPLARIILILSVILLGVLFILSGSGCACGCAHAEEVQIITQAGKTHSFF